MVDIGANGLKKCKRVYDSIPIAHSDQLWPPVPPPLSLAEISKWVAQYNCAKRPSHNWSESEIRTTDVAEQNP